MLLDTSGLLCLLDGREPQRADAETYFGTAQVKITHSYVLAEVVALASSRGVPRDPTLSFAADLQDSSEVEFVWVDEATRRQALELLRERRDKD